MFKNTTAGGKVRDGDGVVRRCGCQRVLRGMETELEALREQNRLLQSSALFFADLSERLNGRLREEVPERTQANDRARGDRA